MKLQETKIPGCYEIEFLAQEDVRGSFVKTFHTTAFRELGLESDFSESFYSLSNQNVLRGLHFQLPPADGAKLVYCLQGSIMDVALNLRAGSPSYGSESPGFSLKATSLFLQLALTGVQSPRIYCQNEDSGSAMYESNRIAGCLLMCSHE